MTSRGMRRGWLWGLAVAMLAAGAGVSPAEPVDFTTFTVDWFPQTNGPLAEWITTPTEARIDDAPIPEGGTPNASVNVFYGPDDVAGKRIIGTLTPGTDDDVVGFVLGYQPGDADWVNVFNLDADYLLIDWKGLTQTFNFEDSPESGALFHTFTVGGEMPVGLALSRVSGIPTADELWQHVDFEVDNPDGGVAELARGATLGSSPYPRDNSSVAVDIRYSATNVTVLVDGVEQFNVDGTFPDGRFGLYSLNQGPSAIWSDFEIFDLAEPLSATIDRDTGEVELSNPTGAPVDFRGYSIASSHGGLTPEGWTSIAENYDEGGAVDADAWTITSSTVFDLSEEEEMAAGDGATIAAGGSINLGAAWTRSPFEDLQMDLVSIAGDLIPVNVEYINGPDGGSYSRSDLNADGVVDAEDWPLFYQNTLVDLSSFSPVEQYLRGDLDGDGDNDVNDFALFKSDFDMANGAGAFARMAAGVPEPSAIVLLLIASLAVCAFRSRFSGFAAAALAATCVFGGPEQVVYADPVDFTTFTVENFPKANGFPLAEWETTPTTAILTEAANNAGANVFYSADSALDTRITGTLMTGFFDDQDMLTNGDDDMVGFVLGFDPGEADYFDPASENADYLLIDWKGVSQTFNWADDAASGITLHTDTPQTNAPVGLAISRVTGMPSADELWGHEALDENPLGGVEELARGATLGSTAYPRDGTTAFFDIRYTADRITVAVDGVVQFNITGDFPDGRFGLYTQGQGSPRATFSDFDITPLDEVTDLLKAVVDRDTGEIELVSNSATPIEFDYYELNSDSQSLNPGGWNSLSEQEFQSVGSEEGQTWAEAGGSNNSAIAELFLQSMSAMGSGDSVSLGNAYNRQIDGQDLQLIYRKADGSLELGIIEYMGEGGGGIDLPGDYSGNGLVEQADLDLVLGNWGSDQVPGTWTNDPPVGIVDQGELDKVLSNWGASAPGLGTSAAVPEPLSLVLISVAALPLVVLRRRMAAAA